VVIPFLGRHLFPLLSTWFGFLPFFRGPAGGGYGLLTAGLVLSLMIVPLITATLRDALVSQPVELREGAMALGATRIEALWTVVLPASRRVLLRFQGGPTRRGT
jgi:phosphate transport system permease protein